jgi:hypothetical protein
MEVDLARTRPDEKDEAPDNADAGRIDDKAQHLTNPDEIQRKLDRYRDEMAEDAPPPEARQDQD